MLNKNSILSAFIFILVQILEPTLSYGTDFHSPRTDALGGAGHASPFLSDALYLNPSFISFNQVHSLSVNYLVYNGTQTLSPGTTAELKGNNFNISVVDGSLDALFQAGVGFTRREDSSMVHVGVSKQVIQKISVGVSSKFIFPNDSSGSRLMDGTFAATTLITTWLQASIIIDNIFNSAKDQNFYRNYILGTKVNIMNIILVYVDPHITSNLPSGQESFGYQAGVELPFSNEFFLRAGTFKNSLIPYQSLRGDGYGFGAGWIGPKLSIDYALSKSTLPNSATAHNFGFSIFF
jgi:hypothetical protein